MQINELDHFSSTVHRRGAEPTPYSPLAAYGWIAHQAARGGGTFITSTRMLARDLGWSPPRTRRFLLSLDGDPLLSTAFDTAGTEIRLRTQRLGKAKAKNSTRGATQPATQSREADHGEPPNEHQQTPRGSRLSADWQPSADDFAYAAERGFDERATHEIADHFADHWRAQPGQKGVKLDWPATWRNWIRRERRPVPRHARNVGIPAAVGEIFDEMDRRGYDN